MIEELGLLGIHGRKFGVFLVRKNCQVSNQIHPRSIPCPPRASPVGAFPSAAGAKGSHENRVCPNEIICLFGNPCKAPLYTRLNWAVHLADSARHLKNKSYPTNAPPSQVLFACLPQVFHKDTPNEIMASAPMQDDMTFFLKTGPMVVWT